MTARIPYVDAATAPEPVRDALRQLPPLNIFRVLAHAETCFRPALRLGQAILAAQQLDPLLRELAILRVAQVTPARYEWVQHEQIALAVGATQEQIEALDRGETATPVFTPAQQDVLRFTDEVIRDGGASDGAFAAVSAFLSPREVIELVLAIGYYMTLARVMEVARIDLDPPAGTAVVDASTRSRS